MEMADGMNYETNHGRERESELEHLLYNILALVVAKMQKSACFMDM